ISHHRTNCLTSVPLLLLIFRFLLASFLDTEAGQIGVCYGKIGNNLPHPVDVVAFYRQRNIHLMWLYDPDQEVLTALNGSNLELLLDVPNSDIQRIASNQSEADTRVRNNVRNYTKGVRFRYISVGNEMQPSDLDAMFLLQAMQNIERAVSDLGVKVSNGFSGFPPSSGSFTPDSRIFFTPVIDFLEAVIGDRGVGERLADSGRNRCECGQCKNLCEQSDTNCEDWISKEARASYRDLFIVRF
ncbi:unnamed protein product, partial [Brassica rapa]